MLTGLRHIAAALLIALVALAIAACGSGGSSAAKPPSGFVVYHGSGFSVSVPKSYVAQNDQIPSAPAGTHTVRLTPGGQSLDQANTDILLSRNDHTTFPLAQIAANLHKADLGDPDISQVTFSSSPAKVTGARSALLVREAYVSPYATSGSARGRFERTWLMIETKSGGLLDVVVALEPQRGATLNPGTVISSVRLSS